MLIVCVDVDYRPNHAVAAGIWFREWTSDQAACEHVVQLADIAAYEPGAFYRRELPCLIAVLARGPKPDVVIVDGYVWLGAERAGLGAHLHAELARDAGFSGAVIGVAKTRFHAAEAHALCRGESRSPLYISAIGVDAHEACARIASMHGEFRVPTLLKRVDTLARASETIA
jgi:deoxyribonuclease V